jgi:hypothetical protein
MYGSLEQEGSFSWAPASPFDATFDGDIEGGAVNSGLATAYDLHVRILSASEECLPFFMQSATAQNIKTRPIGGTLASHQPLS